MNQTSQAPPVHAKNNSACPTCGTVAERKRPLAGFLIAGASLAVLFGIAALKGRVKDDPSTPEVD